MNGDDIYLEGTVKSYGLGKTQSGKVQLAITFDTQDGEHPTVTGYLFFTDAAMEITERALAALGWPPSQKAWAIDDLVQSDELIGAKASLTCAWETFEGKERFKVKFINEVGGAGLKERLTDEEARSFVAQLRQKLGVTGGAKRTASKPKPVTVPDDEIPF